MLGDEARALDAYLTSLEQGYEHRTVCHAEGEYARDDDGDGSCEVPVNTLEGSWSLLRLPSGSGKTSTPANADRIAGTASR